MDAGRRVAARRTMTVAASLLLAVGLTVLVVGWWLGVDIVTRLAPGLVSMKANTAVGFALCGIALLPASRERAVPVAVAAAWALLLLGAATTLEWVVGVDLGIDQLLADDAGDAVTQVPGRPGLNTAVGFVGLGAAQLLGRRHRTLPARLLSQVLAAATGLLALLGLLGYVFGVASTRGLASATEMAIHTSLTMIVAAIGVLATTSGVGLLRVTTSDTDAGRSARVLLPLASGAVLASAILVELLTVLGRGDDPSLQLAFVATAAIVSVVVVVLVVLRAQAESERRAEEASAELDVVRSAFEEVFLRVAPDGVVRRTSRDPADLGLIGGSEGCRLDEVVPPVARDEVDAAVAAARTGVAESRTMVTIDPATTLEFRTRPIDGSADIAMVVRDVTELAASRRALERLTTDLEQQVDARTEQLRRSNAELERFAYLASHDLQEPLRMVSGFVSRLGERYGDQLDDRGKQYVHYAVDGAERMSALIDGLLAYSRAGRVDGSRVVVVELRTLVEEVLATMAATIADAGATVATDLGDASVRGDPVLLRQVVQNLVGNGLKFHREGVAPVVRVTTSTEGATAMLVVEDEGVGIAPDQREAVFEMFRRFGSSATRGTGIGLSLVQQVVDAHGGRTEVADGAGAVGTRFTVRLPRRGEVGE